MLWLFINKACLLSNPELHILLQLDKDLFLVHQVSGLDVDSLDLAGDPGLHGVLHLHGLDHATFCNYDNVHFPD